MTSGAPTMCGGCGKVIVWIRTDDGKTVPCDPIPAVYRPIPSDHGTVWVRDRQAMVNHFSTCPNSSEYSGRNSERSRRSGGPT